MRGLKIEPAWLLPEKRRGYLAVGFCLLATIPALLLIRGGDFDTLASTTLTRSLVVLVAYQLAYVLLTAWALARTPWPELAAWAETSREGSLRARFVDLTEPGAGLALYVSGLALVGTIVLSRSRAAGEHGWLVVALCVALIVLAWVTALLTFTVDYLAKDGRRGWQELTFPGGDERRVGDYLYFATSISTTFGTTDVLVPSRRLRRDVTAHAIVAFVFNTVIIVVTLSLVTSGVR